MCMCLQGLVVDGAAAGGFDTLILGDILGVLGCHVCRVGGVNVIYQPASSAFSGAKKFLISPRRKS